MSNKRFRVGIFKAALQAALLALSACSSLRKDAPTLLRAAIPLRTYPLNASLKAIDTFNREITLLATNGSSVVLWVGPGVTNFNQLQIGQSLLVTVAEELVTSIRAPEAREAPDDAVKIPLAPAGSDATIVRANTVEVPCQFLALDPSAHRATFLLPINRRRTLAVHPRVNLNKFQAPQPVIIRTTKEWAVTIHSNL